MAGYDRSMGLALKNQQDIINLTEVAQKVLTYAFPFDSYLISAEAGDFAVHEPLGWVRTHIVIDLTTYNDVPVFIIPDDNNDEYHIKQTKTFADIQNLHWYGGVFGAEIVLDVVDGFNGMFSAIETEQATSIVDLDGITHPFASGFRRRINAAFGHNHTHVALKTIEGTTGVSLNGINTVNVIDFEGNTVTNKVPEILPGEFFKYEVHVRDGLDKTMFLYVNDILIDNPIFGLNTGGFSGNRLWYTSGSSGDTDRISYIRVFGATINTDVPDVTFAKEELEAHDSVTLLVPNGTRNYSVILPKGLELDVGYYYRVISQATGIITWSPDPATNGLSGRIDGLSTGETLLIGFREIVRTNILLNGAQFVSTEDKLTAFESLRTGMIAYDGMSLHANPLTVTIPARTMRFVDKIRGSSVIIERPAVDFEFTDGLNAVDDLGVVHFYENVAGTIFGSAKTDWSTPEQRIKFVYLGNADVNLTKDGFVQANNPLVSAFGLLDSFGDYLAIGGSIKANGGKVSANVLGLDITGYTAVAWGRNFGNQESPHTPVSSDIVLADLHLGYKTSDIAMLFGPSVNAIDPANYQRIEDTDLSIVPDGQYTIQRVYQYPGTTYNMVVYGSTLYDNLDQAILHTSTERYNLHPSIVPACFLAYIIVRQDVTNLETAITNNHASILNYDGRMHPSTIGAETSPANALQAGGELRSMIDQYAQDFNLPITFIDYEIGADSLYGCEWDAVNKTLKNISQKDMVVNVVPQVGRRATSTSVGLEIFIDSSDDDGVSWNITGANTYATYQSLAAQIDSLTASVLIFRVRPGIMIRVGMMLTNGDLDDKIGIVSNGEGASNPENSISGRALPSCILTIT